MVSSTDIAAWQAALTEIQAIHDADPAPRCDCLNQCGDDPDVDNYKVKPCAYRLGMRRKELAELQRQVRLYEDANKWREHVRQQEQRKCTRNLFMSKDRLTGPLHHLVGGLSLGSRINTVADQLKDEDLQEALQIPAEENHRLTDRQTALVRALGSEFISIGRKLLELGVCEDSVEILAELRRKTGLNIDFTANGDNVVFFDVPRSFSVNSLMFKGISHRTLAGLSYPHAVSRLATLLAAGVTFERLRETPSCHSDVSTAAAALPYQEVLNVYDDWLEKWQPREVVGYVPEGAVIQLGWDECVGRPFILKFLKRFPLAAFTQAIADTLGSPTLNNLALVTKVAVLLKVHGLVQEIKVDAEVNFEGTENTVIERTSIFKSDTWQELEDLRRKENPDA